MLTFFTSTGCRDCRSSRGLLLRPVYRNPAGLFEASSAPGMLLTLATANAQTFPSSLPIAVSCYVQQDRSWRFAYLYRVHANGDAIYITPDGKLTVTVNSKGIVEIPTNRPMGTDCYGKTLDELRASGRVMDFQRAR